MKPPIPSEESEQAAFIVWLNLAHPEIGDLTIHVANERKTSWHFGQKLKRMSVKAGFPDLCLFKPSKSGHHGLFLEFKRKDKVNHKKRPEQDAWLKRLNDQGYKALYVYSFDDAVSALESYLYEGEHCDRLAKLEE